MPQLDLSVTDLQNIVALCNLGIKTHGRPTSKVLDALADKIEVYLEAMAAAAPASEDKAE